MSKTRSLQKSESFASKVEFLQTELFQSQKLSQQEIEQLSNQMEMLQKDTDLEKLHAVENERKKWEAKEDRQFQQLNEALKRSKRDKELSKCKYQCEENILLQSSEEVTYSGLAVPSFGSETGGKILQDLSSEQLPALVSSTGISYTSVEYV